MKRALITATTTVASVLMALTACSTAEPGLANGVPPASDSPSATPESAASTTSAEAATPIDGTWRVTQRVREAFTSLEKAGLGEWTDDIDIFQGADPGTLYEMDMKLQDGQLLTTATLDGRPLGVIDRQVFDVEGGRVRFAVYGSTCAATWRLTLHEASLRLALMKDTCPDYNGTPDAAYMTVIYAAAPFERVD